MHDGSIPESSLALSVRENVTKKGILFYEPALKTFSAYNNNSSYFLLSSLLHPRLSLCQLDERAARGRRKMLK
jgi:hypothetical protein